MAGGALSFLVVLVFPDSRQVLSCELCLLRLGNQYGLSALIVDLLLRRYHRLLQLVQVLIFLLLLGLFD